MPGSVSSNFYEFMNALRIRRGYPVVSSERSRRPDNTVTMFAVEVVASRQRVAVRKSAVRLCCNSMASCKAAFAYRRTFSLVSPGMA
jgi:hypothetical protein